MLPWANPTPQPKLYRDRFNGFCRTHYRDRPTDGHTDHATPSITVGRIYVRSTARHGVVYKFRIVAY